MKTALLVATIAGLSSLSAFGASCITGTATTIAAFDAANVGGCTITNGSTTWTLTTFTIASSAANAAGYANAPTTSDINIQFTLYQTGFKVTYTPLGVFSQAANNGTTAQSLQFDTGFWITGNSGAGAITSIGTDLINPLLTPGAGAGSSPSIGLTKYVHSNIAPYPIYNSYSVDPSYPSEVSPFSNPNNIISITDTLQLRSGGKSGSTATVTGYSNTFLADGNVPEPMTFAMIGAGLVGVAFLRRRK